MSGETELRPSGWTVDTLHTHFITQLRDMRDLLDERAAKGDKAIDAALAAADKLIQAALISAEKAVDKANDANEKRFEAVNEFRGQLTDQALTFVRRDDVDLRMKAMTDRIDAEASRAAERTNDITTRLTTIEQRTVGAATSKLDIRGLVAMCVGFAGVAVAIIVAVFK